MTDLNVYAVILAWNQLPETLECIESLLAMTTQPRGIIVVDNGSSDDTPVVIPRDFPDIVYIRSEENLGVAAGYNLGIDYALKQKADYVLILNNDVIFDAQFLSELLRVAQTHPEVGIIQPKIYHYYGDRSRLWIVGARWRPFPPAIKMIGADQKDSLTFSQVQELEYAPSCALLISPIALQKVGLFDENYFFYYDDWDFCIRVRRAGFRIFFAPEAKMWHKVSVSTVKSDKSGRWWYVMGQSTARFHATYQDLWTLLAVNIWFILRETAKRKFNRIIPYIVGVIAGHAQRLGWVPVRIANPKISILTQQNQN